MEESTRPLLTLLLLLPLLYLTTADPRPKRQTNTQQPRIVTQNGHLLFQTATNHNITFQSNSGGYINVDGENIKAIVQMVKDNKLQVDQLKEGTSGDLANRISNLEGRLESLESLDISTHLTTLSTNLQDLTNRLDSLETATTPAPLGPGNKRQIRYLKNRVRNLERQLTTINTLLTADECQSNPCRNGGTCVDQFNGFFCRCPSNWQGVNCDDDVNECVTLYGTDLGCQNGASCVNTRGSFTCQCTANWHGVRCTESHEDCTGASNADLCGHGTCVNQPRTQPGQVKYKCICDDGWTNAPGSPACTEDVDECDDNNPPCSHSPPVQCINTPGSFICGACPPGFSGNGYVCVDINECETNNGGCSQAPRVECTNTQGSRVCGACPPGYAGNGITCAYVGVCNINNGGCYPQATCTENPNLVSGRTCTCPTGTVGNGEGPSGCVSTSGGSHICDSNPCLHGRCMSSGSSFVCLCDVGYTGQLCHTDIDECASNPCQHSGTCHNQVNGYSCQCPDGWTGQNCQESQQQCGGYLNAESGTFSYPENPGGQYAHQISCAWIITTSPNKILSLTFPRFKLESHPNCEYDFLQIHDGPSASSHMIGKYCGTTKPEGGHINSTHHQIYFWFRSDSSLSYDGFTINWISVIPSCGGDLSGADHGVINSPGYPGNYPLNRQCVWTVHVSPGNNILLMFGHLQLEHHDDCHYDFVEVRDGLLDTDTILGKYCSTVLPPPVTTSGPYARIYFHSDSSETDTGFHITYAAQSAAAGCGGRFTTESGIIISPNYPNPYQHNAQCVWEISVPETETITLTFTNMELEHHSQCDWDYVEVRDGEDEAAPLVGRHCGTILPADYTTSQNNLFVKFSSDPSNAGPGFRATWAVSCGGVYTVDGGILRSPYHPSPYPHDKECEYVIMAPEGKVVTVTFTSFDVEPDSDCSYDYVEVRDGSTSGSSLISRLCGPTLPDPVISSSNNLYLKFASDGSIANHGFSATYAFSEASGSDCGGTMTDTTGQFTSPGHPNQYPHGVTCTWTIEVEPGLVIRLTFDVFALETHSNCNYDYVEIYDNSSTAHTDSLLGRYCGSSVPPQLTSSGNVLTVLFVSDISVATEGFSAHYITFNSTTVCGENLVENNGIISSPNFPDNYPHHKDCEWTITVDTGNQILLNVTDFNLENHPNCHYDYLEIRDGGYHTSPLMGKYCGTTIPSILRSQSNQLYLRFVTDSSASAPGFQIYYDGTLSGCGGHLSSPSGSLTSPNYPLTYNHNSECYWTITAARGSRIHLMFVDMDIETHGSCAYDYVQVRSMNAQGTVLGTYCGTSMPEPLDSPSYQLHIKFRTDYSYAGRGFHAVFYADCDVTLTDYHGVVESPNFPGQYPANRDCVWTINVGSGNKVNAIFSHFDLEAGTNCRYDKLELRDGGESDSLLIGTYCGSALPAQVLTTGPSLYIHFVTDHSQSGNGFRLEYVTDGCGGLFTHPTGSLSSPNYPGNYPANTECRWRISTQPGTSIMINIHEFNVENHPNCNYDSLKIYGGLDEDAPELVTLCHTQTSAQQYTSQDNHMLLVFKTDTSINGRGFRATWETHQDGCGGNFTTPQGVIMSKNYPNAYPHSIECTWHIQVMEGRTVELTFTNFDVEGHHTCNYDSVKIYDGSSPDSPLLARLCGNHLPDITTYTTSNNKMFIRMVSDGSVSANGFKANYITGCGGHVMVQDDGAMTSPGYPGNYEANSNCTWILEAPVESERVTVTFTHLDLESLNNCDHDYIRVLGGNNLDAPEIGTYCGTTVPAAITSAGSALTVVFVSDGSNQRSGFRAIYGMSLSSCGGNLTAEHGAFNSPHYPDSYPDNMECVWTVRTSPGNQVHLSFSLFGLEDSAYCNHDFVEIRKNNAGGEVLGRYCGNNMPSNLTIGHHLWVKFKSNNALTAPGFMAQYRSLYGGEIFGTSGQIASPLFPGNYPHNSDYSWTVTAPSDMYIRVIFNSLDIENGGPACMYDYLRFLDGVDPGSPEIGRYCGLTPPESIHTNTNLMRVDFHTDGSSGGTGFLLSWTAVSWAPVSPTPPNPSATTVPGCGGSMAAFSSAQSFSSPNYPDWYSNNLYCIWLIQSEEGTRVWFNITEIDLETHGSCYYDYLAIYDGDRYSPQLGSSYCGRSGNDEPIYSTSNSLTVRFHSDHSVNRPGFQAAYKSACGGTVQGSAGEITSPDYPANYGNDDNCTWTIQVLGGRTVEINFDSMNIVSGSSGCAGDYVELFNGGGTDSPSLGSGRYCGSTVPTIPESSGNMVTIRFITDGSGTSPGFKLTWTEKTIECGGHFTLTDQMTSGEFSSPNYPEDYPINVDCMWVILAPSSENIQIDFDAEFHIEEHRGCAYDYVEVRDGGTENAPLLTHSCGTTRPSTQKSTGNVMFIRFHTDHSMVHKGFKATFAIGACGGTYHEESAVIQSPNYPANYGPNEDCVWYFHGPTGHYLTFSFDAFNTELASNCTQADWLDIRDFNSTGTILGRYCGSTLPSPVDTYDSFGYAQFRSNGQTASSGFQITYQASVEECGGMLTAPSATIQSPNYPGLYAHNRRCWWKIRAQHDRRVTFTFTDMDLEDAISWCYRDYVRIQNGILRYSPTMGRYCGTEIPDPVKSSGNTMTVMFKTDGTEGGRGFSGTYTSTEPAKCGGILTASNGTIESPDFQTNETYMNSEECIWRINNPVTVNGSIVITFTNISIEHVDSCYWDYVAIHEGDDENGHRIGRYCGTDIPDPIVSPSNSLWLMFHTDYIIVDKGFSLDYRFTSCGGLIAETSGVITSPNYPNNYDNNGDCAWKIMAPEGYRVNIHFTQVDIVSTDKCRNDYVEIFNGGLASSPSIGKYCGTSVPTDFRSMSHEVRIVFHSDDTLAATGFRLEFHVEAEGCGGTIHGREGDISSPNWPDNYVINTECVWEINVDEGYHVAINFNHPFELEIAPGCPYDKDYVMISERHAHNELREVDRFCGNVYPANSTIASTNQVQVKFRSNNEIVGNGFSLHFMSACGGTYEEDEGIIVSPGFPNNYDNFLDCEYLISHDPQKFIVLEFTDFDVEGGSACPWDWVEVFDGPNASSPQLGKFCGETAPQPLIGRGSMFIKFHTDNIITKRGWRATYRTSECGGVFTDETAQIATPTHPANYHHNANCSWQITVAENRAVSIKFNTFEIEAHESCNFDYVEIYDGLEAVDDKKIGRFCGNVAPDAITSLSNSLLVVFITDSSVSYSGFSATYRTTLGELQGCGGYLNGSTGTLGTIDMSGDGNYEPDLDCKWTIVVPSNMVVKMRFNKFNLEPDYNCSYDYLEMRDGMYPSDHLVGRYCGQTSPEDFIASSNALYVVFHSDHDNHKPGFNATYTIQPAVCGGAYTASADENLLQSPNYPGSYPHNIRCRWTVDAPGDDHVRLTIKQIDIDGSTDCHDDYIELRDTPMGDDGQSVHYCGTNTSVYPFITAGNTVQINLVTDESSSGQGFKLGYQISSCNRTYSGDHGRIQSPHWPGNYPAFSHCETLISAPEGSSLTLYFNHFYVEPHPECNFDYLKIYNGSDDSGDEIATLCNNILPDPITVPGNHLYMVFITDNSVQRDGYDISYTSSPQGCGGNLTGTYGVVTSPSYPGAHQVSAVCRWLVTVPARHRPTISWSQLDFGTSNCDDNYVEVYNGASESSPKIATYCGSELPAGFTMSGRSFYVKYSSSSSNQGVGFKLDWSTS